MSVAFYAAETMKEIHKFNSFQDRISTLFPHH